jgi:hypothetical protein
MTGDAFSEIERTQEQLRVSIEKSKELADKSDQLIRAHRQETARRTEVTSASI